MAEPESTKGWIYPTDPCESPDALSKCDDEDENCKFAKNSEVVSFIQNTFNKESQANPVVGANPEILYRFKSKCALKDDGNPFNIGGLDWLYYNVFEMAEEPVVEGHRIESIISLQLTTYNNRPNLGEPWAIELSDGKTYYFTWIDNWKKLVVAWD